MINSKMTLRRIFGVIICLYIMNEIFVPMMSAVLSSLVRAKKTERTVYIKDKIGKEWPCCVRFNPPLDSQLCNSCPK